MIHFTAGDNIEARCTKCKLSLDHVIVAMVAGSIAKVKCKTCGSTHRYKDPAAPVVKSSTPRAKKVAAPPSRSQWELAMADAQGEDHPYAMTSRFRTGYLISHPNFGRGIVTKILPGKCNILFQDRERLMVCGNK